MKALLSEFAKRKDVWFSFISVTTGAVLVYAQYMPPWVIILLVVMREGFGLMGMAKSKAESEDKSEIAGPP